AEWINGLTTAESARRDVFVECPLPHPTIVVRREVLMRAGRYRACPWPEDYDLVLRLWLHGARFRNVDETVLRRREHPTRASRTDAAYSLDAFIRCKVHYLRAGPARRPRRRRLGSGSRREDVREGAHAPGVSRRRVR